MSITNTSGRYACTVSDATAGFAENKPERPAIQLVFRDENGGEIEKLYRMYGGAIAYSQADLKDLFGDFKTPADIIGQAVSVVTGEIVDKRDGSKSYGVKFVNKPGKKALEKSAPGLFERLASTSHAAAPAPRRSDTTPAIDAMDDDSVPF